MSDESSIVLRDNSPIISDRFTDNMALNLFRSILGDGALDHRYTAMLMISEGVEYHGETTFMRDAKHQGSARFRSPMNSEIVQHVRCTPFDRDGLWRSFERDGHFQS